MKRFIFALIALVSLCLFWGCSNNSPVSTDNSAMFDEMQGNEKVRSLHKGKLKGKRGYDYMIIPRHAPANYKRVLEIANESKSKGGLLQMWKGTGGKHRIWNIYFENPSIKKWCLLSPKHVSGKLFLDVQSKSQKDGALIMQWRYNEGSNQKFRIERLENGYFIIRAKHSGKVLTVPGGTLQKGAKIIQQTYSKKPYQEFKIVEVKR